MSRMRSRCGTFSSTKIPKRVGYSRSIIWPLSEADDLRRNASCWMSCLMLPAAKSWKDPCSGTLTFWRRGEAGFAVSSISRGQKSGIYSAYLIAASENNSPSQRSARASNERPAPRPDPRTKICPHAPLRAHAKKRRSSAGKLLLTRTGNG